MRIERKQGKGCVDWQRVSDSGPVCVRYVAPMEELISESDALNYLTQAVQWERADELRERVGVLIANAKNYYASRRGKALLRSINPVNKAMKYERGLAMVQQGWLQTITRNEALH